MKGFEEEIVDNDGTLSTVNEVKILTEEDKYKNDSRKDLKKEYPDKIGKLEETLLNYLGKNDRISLKREFLDKQWKYLTEKLPNSYEKFNSLHDCRKTDENL